MHRPPRRRLLAAAATCAWLLAVAASAEAHPPAASFEYAPAQPQPGELVAFRSTTTPAPDHTEPLRLDWDLDADGQFDDGNGPIVRRGYPAGDHVVRLRARYIAAAGTHEDIAERTITVGGPEPEPTPVPNQAPVAAFDKQCKMTGSGLVFCAGLFAREQKPHTIDASPSHDPDGSIVRYQWDLDNNGSFEVDTGATPTVTHVFDRLGGLVDNRKRTVRVRVTDDDGAMAEASMTLTLLEPACEPLVTYGRLRASGLCLRPRHIQDAKIVRWYSDRPVTLNGISIAPAPNRTVTIDLPEGPGGPAPRIASNGAAVTIPVQGSATRLLDGAFSWRLLDGEHLTGFELGAGARLNGLRITGVAGKPSLNGTSSRFALRVALPSQFGGATSDDPVVVTPGAATASAGDPLRFEVANAAVGPIGLEKLVVTFDGDDLWEIETAIQLPDPIPYTIAGDAGIRSNGDFEHAGASVDFGTPGIGPLGPIYLQRIAFRIEVKPKKSK